MFDPYGIWSGSSFSFDLDTVCKIIYDKTDYSIPPKFNSILHQKVMSVAADYMPAKDGIRIVFDLSWKKPLEKTKETMVKYIEAGVIVVSNRTFFGKNNKPLDSIYVDDVWEAWIALGRYVKKVLPMPTIAITGSTGKTTCTMFAKHVFDERYNVFISGENGKNFNVPQSIVVQWLLRCNETNNFHIQECGGETPKLIETSARIIDACLLYTSRCV